MDVARRYVALAGGADKAVAATQTAFDQGDFRWAAELLNHVVMADSGHTAAGQLPARTYDQLGYVVETATWRNSYLTAAAELRGGPPQQGINRAAFLDMLAHTPIERFLEAIAAGLNGPAAEGKDFKINLVLTDTKDSHVLWIENAVLHHRRAEPAADANATLTLTQGFFVRMMAGTAGAKDMLMSDDVKVTGSKIDLARFLGLLEKATGAFPSCRANVHAAARRLRATQPTSPPPASTRAPVDGSGTAAVMNWPEPDVKVAPSGSTQWKAIVFE